MAVSQSIFGVQPAAETSYADDIVGRFAMGYQDAGGNPHSTTEWIVRTDDPDVAEAISEMLGGVPQDSGQDKYPAEVFTTTSSIDVLVKPGGIRSGMVLWGNRSLVQRCDGDTITWSKDDPQDVGKKCACSGKSPEDRAKAAKRGTGCKPDISVLFQLAASPGLGTFRFQSGSGILLKDIQGIEARVADADDKVALTISLEAITTKAGFTFTKVTVAPTK